jgi:hypothetical protein
MINVTDMQNSFLLSWVKKLQDAIDEKWSNIPQHYLSGFGPNFQFIFTSSVPSKKIKGLGLIKSEFWRKALETWIEIFHEINTSKSLNLPLNKQQLWNNSNIIYKGQCLFLKDWVSKITYVSDIMENNQLFTFDQICSKIGNKPCRIFEYNALKTATESCKLKLVRYQMNNETEIVVEEPMLRSPKQFRHYIVYLNSAKPVSERFWLDKFGVSMDKNDWNRAVDCIDEVRLQVLHWKILHNIYPTKILLHKMKLEDNNLCPYCNVIDFIEHFFYSCSKISKIWKLVEEKVYSMYDVKIKITAQQALLGFPKQQYSKDLDHYINQLILVAKMCIGIFRYGTPIEISCLFQSELLIRGLDTVHVD